MSFNAATTRESWKAISTTGAGEARLARFNAATTRESWKDRHHRAQGDRVPGASTQPRLVSRGKSAETLACCSSGSGFNAATTRESWKAATDVDPDPASVGFNAATTRESWKEAHRELQARINAALQRSHDS